MAARNTTVVGPAPPPPLPSARGPQQQQQIGITEAKATHGLHMLLFTLHCVSQGGLCDQLGGGFARYSLDEFWSVPPL